jgi:large subunit ribosomal protein LP0
VGCNNVGSKQFQQIRGALRGKAVVLMGKNTMMRRIISDIVGDDTSNPINNVMPLVVGNIGFIFTKGDLAEVKKIVENNRVPAIAKAGQIAMVDVVVPPGPTGCDPGQTQWFQALNVPTKITKGQIEIVSELKLINKGNVVGSSEAALLQKLNIRPFSYGLVLSSVYDNGAVFDAKVLDITADALNAKFYGALARMAALSLASGYPTMASLPHSVGNGVRSLIAIAAASGYSFEQMAEFDKFLNMSPEELAKLAAASAASGAPASPSKGGAAKKEEVKEEPVEVDLGGGGLFGGGEAAKY